MEEARRTKAAVVQRVDCQYDVFMAIHRTIILPVEFHPALDATLTEASKAYRVISEMAF